MLKGHRPAHHLEHDHAEGEQVSVQARVRQLEQDLRGLVPTRPDDASVEAVSMGGFDFGGQAQINDFDVVVFVQDQIFHLQIAMCPALTLDSDDVVEQLGCVVPADRFVQRPTTRDVVEELAVRHQLLQDEADRELGAVRFH